MNEALLLKNLDHPNVIKVHDFFKTPFGLFCIVMDYAEGFSIQKIVKDIADVLRN